MVNLKEIVFSRRILVSAAIAVSGTAAVLWGINAYRESRTVVLPPPMPTSGDVSGVGGGEEATSTPGAISTVLPPADCVRIGDLPQDRQTTWSALGELSRRAGEPFDPTSDQPVTLVHEAGDAEVFTIDTATDGATIVFDADRWCWGAANP